MGRLESFIYSFVQNHFYWRQFAVRMHRLRKEYPVTPSRRFRSVETPTFSRKTISRQKHNLSLLILKVPAKNQPPGLIMFEHPPNHIPIDPSTNFRSIHLLNFILKLKLLLNILRQPQIHIPCQKGSLRSIQ